jgi:hypothetical protein
MAFTVRGTAQSSTPALPAPPHSPYKFHLDGQVPPLFGQVGAQSPPNSFKLPRLLANPFMPPQNTLIASADSVPKITWHAIAIPRHIVVPRSRSEDTCYAIRSYAYVRDNPASDATRLTGSSTCQPATSSQVMAVVDPQQP